MNILTVAELKRRGMAGIEDGLRQGPVHIVKRNKPAAVVISAEDYQGLIRRGAHKAPGMTAVQWLLACRPVGSRGKARIDADLKTERNNW
jgi:hypothetical protein